MIAEILATGDEIRTGALVDSNSAYIAEALVQIGVQVVRHQTVGDDLDMLAAVITETSGRVDACVVTGGLGPTDDDLTAEAMARAAGVELVLDERALKEIAAFFEERGRVMNPSNRKQAWLPRGASALYNPVGTAPGFELTIGRCIFFCLPGVPMEMKTMLSSKVLPRLLEVQGARRRFCLARTISSFGLPESAVGEKMAGFRDRFPVVKIGWRAKFPEIQVKLYLDTDDEPAGRRLLAEAADWVALRLGENLFSMDGRSMAEEVGEALKSRRATVALAESCTGGLVADWLTNIAGSSDYFLFSAVTYANEAKVNVLGVSPQTLASVGAVDEQTAREMAAGARRLGGAHYGLAVTGIAGPSGGSEQKPVGTVCIAVDGPGGTESRRLRFSYGRRLMNKRVFAMAALDLLRRALLKAGPP